jgi:IS30 family transposase
VASVAKNITNSFNLDTLTLDNGQENRDHLHMGIDTYFCNTGSPQQKPHVECNIGLVRKWFIPKKTDLRKISHIQLQEYFHILNSKYRKSLNYRSAYEVALERGIIKSLPVEIAFEGRI